eukprot:s905_g22.t1
MIDHDGRTCTQCQRELEEGRTYPCPAGCGGGFCSLHCVDDHRDGPCRRKIYVMPKFGERFAGPNAPLSRAVARAGGVEVQKPYDLLTGSDYFTPAGKAELDTLESDPALAAEHWGPECRLFSRARGRPVRLPDGRTVPGPPAVRDARHVMGYPWANNQTKIDLRRSNNMALRGLKRMQGPFGESRYVTLEHPYDSWLWYFSIIEELRNAGFEFASGTYCCFGGQRTKWYALLNNSPEIQQELDRPNCPGHDNLVGYEATVDDRGRIHYATAEESEYKPEWCAAYARGLKRQLAPWIERGLQDGRCRKLQKELASSTARLADPAVANAVANEVIHLEGGMTRGNEAAHLREMGRNLNQRH